jgi:chemotaxis signal transduction protein
LALSLKDSSFINNSFRNMYGMVENTIRIDTLTGLVVFALGSKEFCADIKEISAIINPNEIRVETDQDSDKQGIRINNLQIPLLNLHDLFNLTSSGSDEDKRILAVEPDDNIYGFVVDKVKEIFTMSRDFKEKLEFIPVNDEENIAGLLKYEDRSLYLPDYKMLQKKYL